MGQLPEPQHPRAAAREAPHGERRGAPGHGASPLASLATSAGACVGGSVALGFGVGPLAGGSILESLTHMPVGVTLMLAGIILAAMVISVLIHELGHLAAGRLAGWRFVGLALGPWWLTRNVEGRWSILRVPLPRAMGQCLMLPRDANRLRRRMFLFILGGPAANLVAAGLAILFRPSVDALWHDISARSARHTDASQLRWRGPSVDGAGPDSRGRGTLVEGGLIACAAANVLLGVVSFVPTFRPPLSDGRQLLRILAGGHAWRSTAMELITLSWLEGMKAPEDWPEDVIALGLAPADGSDREAYYRFLSFVRTFARRDRGRTAAEAERLTALQERLPPPMRCFARAFLLVAALERGETAPDDADDWCASMSADLCGCDPVTPLLARSALLALRGEDEEAKRALLVAARTPRQLSHLHDLLTMRLSDALIPE